MVNPKATKISEEQKDEIKDIVEGTYDKAKLNIDSPHVHSKADLDAMVKALNEGKAYVFGRKATRNTVYNIRKRLRDEYNLKNVLFGYVKETKQSVIYLS